MHLTKEVVETSEHPGPTQHIAKELLLLGLARAARGKQIDRTKVGDESQVAKVEEACGIADARERLGNAYPHLTPEQDAAVVLAFEKTYKQPCSHDDGDNQTHHHHGSTSCSKSGPIHGLVRKIEQKVLSAIGGKRGHRIVAIVLRGGALLFCPGDDLATIGMQIYGSISGQAAHSRHAEQAILPSRIVSQKTVVRPRTPLCS